MITTVYSNDSSIDWKATGDDRIVQNVRNILRTKLCEVPFMRDFGINHDFLDAPPHTLRTDFQSHVIDVIAAGESRATVRDVRIESCDENGNYVIAVDLEV